MTDKEAYMTWCLTATDPDFCIEGKPVPVITTLLYRVCVGDAVRFREADRILEEAFNAGVAEGLRRQGR